MAQAIDRRPAVVLLEVDGLGSTRGVQKMGSLPQWEADLRYEINAMQALPHTVVYVEGGYSDSNSVAYTAKVLNAIGVDQIRGFFTNDTHEAWTVDEARWATAIAKRTHGSHFIVDTADNGRGPLYNHVKVGNGVEDLCNPPKRGLGPRNTTQTPATPSPTPGCGPTRPETRAAAAADLPVECSGPPAPRPRLSWPTTSSARTSPQAPTDPGLTSGDAPATTAGARQSRPVAAGQLSERRRPGALLNSGQPRLAQAAGQQGGAGHREQGGGQRLGLRAQ